MSTKFKNSKKKMAALGLKKSANGDYTYIDVNDKDSEFTPIRKRQKNS